MDELIIRNVLNVIKMTPIITLEQSGCTEKYGK